jgi:hypothetical protein
MGRKQKMKLSLRILLMLSLLLGFGTAGSVWAEEANVRIEQWRGHSFTFLDLPADAQSAGYEIFTVGQAVQGFDGDASARIPYAEHVGKQVTVTELAPFQYSRQGYADPAADSNQQDYMVHMTVNDTGEKLIGRSLRGQVEGLVLTADLNNARQQFLGKTVYSKSRGLSGLTLPGSGTVPTEVFTPIGAPVKVVDVYLGNQSQKPITLIVSVNGEKAVIPILYSWTNSQVQSWEQTPPWQEAVFMEDPRISLGGSPELWNKIENGTVEKNMTKGQVRLSWGKPLHIEANNSVWIYNTQKLSFQGDVLYSIETLQLVSDES